MDILEENKNPQINSCTGKPEKMCVDWSCHNQNCKDGDTKRNGFSNFVDGGSVFTPAKVRFICEECGISEIAIIS